MNGALAIIPSSPASLITTSGASATAM